MTGTVIFRCNVSARVGVGHLMRCREMARHLGTLGWQSVLLGPPDILRDPVDADLFCAWHAVDERGSSDEDAARLLALCEAHGTRYAVMDDYRIDPGYQTVMRDAGLRWLQQFDASRPWMFQPDLLVNASPYETRAHYLPWLVEPARTETLFGPAYAVLRPAYTTVSARADGRTVRRIFVGFGGGDDRGAIDQALRVLAGKLGPEVTLVIVSGSGNPRRIALAEAVAALPAGQAEFHVNPPDIAGLMQGCDLALIGGGTMSYEAAICGLPMIFVGLAPNQERPCRGWQDLTGAPFLGLFESVTDTHLYTAVAALVEDDDRRRAMASKGRALVDGQGTQRLVEALLEREREET
ncbi:flagellin modification protein FlmD [uncultured Roseovarius sp.]|uniref:PseG/SpsG family protein n=1 Tax=uncultured Roseovarius sp. TaxID=293344 RepID=UPI0026051D7E|nr:flagellin modification protein FlmD [uncultured Roseovarius sp.]